MVLTRCIFQKNLLLLGPPKPFEDSEGSKYSFFNNLFLKILLILEALCSKQILVVLGCQSASEKFFFCYILNINLSYDWEDLVGSRNGSYPSKASTRNKSHEFEKKIIPKGIFPVNFHTFCVKTEDIPRKTGCV